jgi:uncharacterized protein (TIGR02145 family)
MKAMSRRVSTIACSMAMACALPGTFVVTFVLAEDSATGQNASRAPYASKRMLDGIEWTTANLNIETEQSYCYDDAEQNCRRYGRLYTWPSAQRVCGVLGQGWRLPTDDEWRRLAKQYGGAHDDADDGGKAAFAALLNGGGSGFDVLLGGGRAPDGQYARGEAHGFYWTASESAPDLASYYNFGKGSGSLYRQREGEKQWAFSVRCIHVNDAPSAAR